MRTLSPGSCPCIKVPTPPEAVVPRLPAPALPPPALPRSPRGVCPSFEGQHLVPDPHLPLGAQVCGPSGLTLWAPAWGGKQRLPLGCDGSIHRPGQPPATRRSGDGGPETPAPPSVLRVQFVGAQRLTSAGLSPIGPTLGGMDIQGWSPHVLGVSPLKRTRQRPDCPSLPSRDF